MISEGNIKRCDIVYTINNRNFCEPIANEMDPPIMDELQVVASCSDVSREEMKWMHSHESLLNEWETIAMDTAEKQYEAAGKKKRWFQVMSVVATILPLLVGNADVTGTEMSNHFHRAVFVLLAAVNGFMTVANLGRAYGEHYHYEAGYRAYAKKIATEMSKPKHNRVQCDVFINEMKMEINRLDELSPAV